MTSCFEFSDVITCYLWRSCRYRWIYNDSPLDLESTNGRVVIQSGNGTLVFQRPTATDDGVYQCLAYNILGTAASVKVSFQHACKLIVAPLTYRMQSKLENTHTSQTSANA